MYEVWTPRLHLRSWKPSDAPALKQAIDESLEELKPWLPWAWTEPSTLDSMVARLSRFEVDFDLGRDWVYGVFERGPERVVGGSGLHRRRGPDALEIGYWLRSTSVGRGYATELAAALTRVALEHHKVRAVQIRCDPNNLRSAAIPKRLGYRHRTTLRKNQTTPEGAPRDTEVWKLRQDEFDAANPAWQDVRVKPTSSLAR